MATQAYKVKKGDTRSALAAQFGVGIGDITGRSADPNMLYEGETVQIGKKEPDAYVNEVKDQLGSDTGASKPAETDEYGIESYKTKASEASKNKEAAFNSLKDLETTTYNTEYEKKGLGAKKERISQIDSDIATARTIRDNSIAEVRKNPNLSAAEMAGDVKKFADAQNAKINNYIQERNSVASEYNAGLAEIDKVVSKATSDAEREYNYWTNEEKTATSGISEYQKTLAEELKAERTQSNFEKQLAQALEIARMKSSDDGANLKLITNPITGKPMYWSDPSTGTLTPITETLTTPGGSSDVDTEDATAKAEALAEQLGMTLEEAAKAAGFTKGGFLGIGKKGDVDAYIESLK